MAKGTQKLKASTAGGVGTPLAACNNRLQDAQFHLDRLVRLTEKSVLTVASEEVTNKAAYDFPNLVEALEWGKQIGSAVNQPQGFQFDLAPGTHFWEDTNILSECNSCTGGDLTYMRDISMTINGMDKNNTHIIFKNTNSDIHFEDAYIDFRKVSFELSGFHSVDQVKMISDSSVLKFSEVNMTDMTVAGEHGGMIFLNKDIGLANHFSPGKVAFDLSGASYMQADATDFGGVDLEINAVGNSHVFLSKPTNHTNLVLSSPLNKTSNDLSIIYDENVSSALQTNLGLVQSVNDVSITSSTGKGITIPEATDKLAGMLGALDKQLLTKLQSGVDGSVLELLFRSMTDSARLLTVPALGEPIWTTDTHKVYIGDGVTAGGVDITHSASAAYIKTIEKGALNGVAELNAQGKVPHAQLPDLAISKPFVVTSQLDMLALNAQTGDVAIRTDLGETYILDGDPSVPANWHMMLFSAGVAALDDLNDVTITAPQPGQTLFYDGVKWINVDSNHQTGTAWSAGHSYLIGDVISNGGHLYVAIADNIGSAPPSNDWKLQTVVVNTGMAFQPIEAYNVGDIVTYNNHPFVANSQVLPGTWDPTQWDHVGHGNAGTVWVPNAQYKVNDIVYYTDLTTGKMGLYSCLVNNTSSNATTDTPQSTTKWAELVADPGII